MLNSNHSITNIIGTDILDLDSIKIILKNIPTSRTNFYFETKSINGFKSDLQEEIQDLLVELQSAEDNLQKIIKIFILFLEKYEKIINEKEENIFHLTNENEKLIMKLTFGQTSHDPLIQENLELLDKIAHFTNEVETLDKACQKYEEIINDLNKRLNMNNSKNKEISTINLNDAFLENYDNLKIAFPNYFCQCLGDYESVKQQNYGLKEKISDLRQENDELSQTVQFLKQKLEKFEQNDKRISYENQRLKAEITKIQITRDTFLKEITEDIPRRNLHLLRMRSLSIKKNENILTENEENQRSSDFMNKHCRSPHLLKKRNKNKSILPELSKEISQLRENVRRKTRTYSIKYSTLLSEIQKSLEGCETENSPSNGTMDNIFEDFDKKDDKVLQRNSVQVFDNQSKYAISSQTFFEKKENNEIIKKSEKNEESIKIEEMEKIEKKISYQKNEIFEKNENFDESNKSKIFVRKPSIKKNLKNSILNIQKHLSQTNSDKNIQTKTVEFANILKSEEQMNFSEENREIQLKLNENKCNISKLQFQKFTNFKKTKKFYGKVKIFDFLIFIQLSIISMITKIGYFLIDTNKKKENKGIIMKSIGKLRGFWIEVLRINLLFYGFIMVWQLNCFNSFLSRLNFIRELAGKINFRIGKKSIKID